MDCAFDDMKYIFYGIVKCALAKIVLNEQENQEILKNFIVESIGIILMNRNNSEHIYRTLYSLAKISKISRQILESYNFLHIFKEFILDEPFSKKIEDLKISQDYSVKCELKPISLLKKTNNDPNSKILNNPMQKVSTEKKIREFAYLVNLSCELLLDEVIVNEDFVDFFKKEENLKKIFSLCKKKVTFSPIAKMVCHFVKNDPIEFSNKIIEMCFKELMICDEAEMKVYWIILEHYLKIEDSNQENRVLNKFRNSQFIKNILDPSIFSEFLPIF